MDRPQLLRSHEVADYKRCPKKWYWKWRKGLVPKAVSFGALDLGLWLHSALAGWYSVLMRNRTPDLLVSGVVDAGTHAIFAAKNAGAPEPALDKAEELLMLGKAMAEAYARHYGTDPVVRTIQAELPLEFEITDEDGSLIAVHKLKPDLVYRTLNGDVWLMEHKSAAVIRTEHLAIDGQARPYGALAQRALRRLGVIGVTERVKGITYNFLRKALPDPREHNAAGQYLNKNGTVSKRQPVPLFQRFPVLLTARAKIVTLRRLRADAYMLALLTKSIREKRIDPADIPKTPHHSCPKTCQFFTMCVLEEEGADIRDMQRSAYVRQDPYIYDEDSTDEPAGFEMS